MTVSKKMSKVKVLDNQDCISELLQEVLNGKSFVGSYYKRTSIFIEEDVWLDTVKRNFSSDLTDEQLIKQTEELTATFKSKSTHQGQLDILSIVFVANIAELLKRKLIKNDKSNGWIFYKAQKLTK